MAKLAILIVAALVLQATFADDAQQSVHVRSIRRNIQSVSSDAVNAVQNIKVDQHQGKNALVSQANEYAHDVHVAVYHLHQAIQINRNHGAHSQQVLEQVADRLSDIAHSVEHIVDGEPGEIKNVLKSNVHSVVVEVDKLAQVAQEHHNHAQQGHDNVSDAVEDVLDELIDAIRQLEVRGEIQHESHQQTKQHVQEVVNDVSNVIQKVNSHDEETAHELAHQAHELAHVLGQVVHRLRRVVHHHRDHHHPHGDSKNIIRQVANKISEIRASLEEVDDSHGQDNVQVRVSELKNHLKTNVHNVAAQVERLIQVVESGNQTEQGVQDVSNLVKDVVAVVVTGIRHVEREVQVVVDSHQSN